MSGWIESWSWKEAPNARRCALCGGGLEFWNSDIESAVHDGCGKQCSERLSNLAANLATAGGLQLSWDLCHEYNNGPTYGPEPWHPGCGNPAPGWSKGEG